MTEAGYSTSFTVPHTPEQVFAAVNDVRGWWSADIEGDTARTGDVWFYRARDLHRCTLKVEESVPSRRVAWRVLDNTFSFIEDKTEWIDTRIVFDIAPTDAGTRLTFTHVGLLPDDACYEVCHDAWGTYVRGSLRDLIVRGTGAPNVGETITAEGTGAGDDSFTTRFEVAAGPDAVFAAINRPREWWSGEFEGATARLGDIFTYRYKDIHYSKQEVTELVPDQRVAWQVLEGNLAFVEDKTEWVGTTIRFDIVPKGALTELTFTHVGLKPRVECYDTCTDAWTSLIRGSLKQLIEQGRADRIEL